jgi:hypothetical protein
VAVVALALLVADCARRAPARVEDTRKPAATTPPATAAPPSAATLVPADLALAFLQGIKPAAAGIPACRFTDKGTWSAGEYRRVTGQRAPTQITSYPNWILFKIDDASGREFRPADLERSSAWSYTLRTPRTARTPFGVTDNCVVGPTSEPPKKVVEALTALGVALAPEYAYIVR